MGQPPFLPFLHPIHFPSLSPLPSLFSIYSAVRRSQGSSSTGRSSLSLLSLTRPPLVHTHSSTLGHSTPLHLSSFLRWRDNDSPSQGMEGRSGDDALWFFTPHRREGSCLSRHTQLVCIVGREGARVE